MTVWDQTVLWSFLFLLPGAVGQTFKPQPSVIYPFIRTCAVKGSTVTLPCTFTPATSVTGNGREVQVEIIRVVWCQNHEICHGITPSVYDSVSTNNNPRYQYLGDKKRNCTLQIRDIQKKDDATFRFRMEAIYGVGHFTNRTGVRVSVEDGTKMRIKSSSNNNTFTRGQSVTLQCTTVCTFNQLEVTWFRDGHALSESGPTLQLSYLTAKDSGNYTCALKKNTETRSLQYSLQVEEPEEGSKNGLIVGVVFGVLLAVITLILVVFIVKRKWAAAEDQRALGGQMKQRGPDQIFSGVQTEDHQQETDGAEEDVSYASIQFINREKGRKGRSAADQGETKQECPDYFYSSVQTGSEPTETDPAAADDGYASVEFKNKKKNRRREEKVEDAVIYAGVVSRG